MWFENKDLVELGPERVWVKLHDKGEEFGSALVPSKYFPLKDGCHYEVFHCENTNKLTDKKIVAAFNSVEPAIDRCFENTKKLCEAFKKIGIDLMVYVGWRFQDGCSVPEHMCWATYDHHGKSVLDLSDTQDLVDAFLTEHLDGDPANWSKASNKTFMELQKRLSVPNSERCAPLGVPSKSFLYVGCPCSIDDGLEIRWRLIEEFPDHIGLTGLNNKPE